MKNGFTLVELSIVLVIIGLLTGGILVAQSMISTTEITNTVSTLQKYEVAAVNFKNKYRQTPGDSNLFANPGNNNGLVATDSWMYGNCGNSKESYNFWFHLNQSSDLRESFNGSTGAGCTAGFSGYVPLLKIGKNNYLNAGNITTSTAFPADWGNGWWISDSVGNVSLTTSEAHALDKKTDDGLPVTGSFQVMYIYSGPNLGTTAYSGNCALASPWPTFKYTLTNTGPQCAVAIKADW